MAEPKLIVHRCPECGEQLASGGTFYCHTDALVVDAVTAEVFTAEEIPERVMANIDHVELALSGPRHVEDAIRAAFLDSSTNGDDDDFCEHCNGSFGGVGCEHCNPEGQAASGEEAGEGEAAREELQKALEDALRRSYSQGWYTPAPYSEPADPARILEDPDKMRQLARIQKAAWDVVSERIEPAATHPQNPGERAVDADWLIEIAQNIERLAGNFLPSDPQSTVRADADAAYLREIAAKFGGSK